MPLVKVNPGQPDEKVLSITVDETLIGRSDENTVVIDNPGASSRHCVILRSGDRYTLRDLNSTNGTFLNGARVTECPLAPGDIINVGSTRVLFEGEDINTASPPAIGTGPRDTVRTAGAAPPEFVARKSRKGVWIGLWILVSLGLLGLVWWFWTGLFR